MASWAKRLFEQAQASSSGKLLAVTGVTVNAGNLVSAEFDCEGHTCGLASVWATGVTGTSPTLDVKIDYKDANGRWYPAVGSVGTQMTSAPSYTFGNIGAVNGAGFVLPSAARLSFVISGGSVWTLDLSVVGR